MAWAAAAAVAVAVATAVAAVAATWFTVAVAAAAIAATRATFASRTAFRWATGRFQALDHGFGQLALQVLLDTAYAVEFARFGNGDRHAATASTAGTANTVYVVFGLFWQVVVHNQANAGYIDTASGDVGGYQDLDAATTQVVQGTVTPALRHVAVQAGCAVAHVGQLVSDFFGADLGGGKHDCLVKVGFFQDRIQQALFVIVVICVQQVLFDIAAFLFALDLDALRVAGHAFCHLAHDTVQGSGEQQGLTLARGSGYDGFDVFDEAHVQHAVGFVQSQHFQAGEIDTAGAHVVHQAARGGHDDVNRARQGAGLEAERCATHQGNGTQPAQLFAVNQGIFFYLLGQLAGRGQYQNAWAVAGAFGALADTGQCWQQEGGGFAATGLCRNKQVATSDGGRHGFALYRGRRVVAGFFQCFGNSGGQPQVGELLHGESFQSGVVRRL